MGTLERIHWVGVHPACLHNHICRDTLITTSKRTFYRTFRGADTVPSLKGHTMTKPLTQQQQQAVVAMYYNGNTYEDIKLEMGIGDNTIAKFVNVAKAAGAPNRVRKISTKVSERSNTLEFKHTVCCYYTNHTGDQTSEKFDVTTRSIHMWRKDLGYPNKHYGRNIKHDRTDNDVKSFKVTKTASGKYRASILQGAVAALTAAVVALKGLE